MALHYRYNPTRLDYYTYGEFSGTIGYNSGATAAVTGRNEDCDFSYLDLSGVAIKHRRYNNIYPDEYPPEITRDVTDNTQYNDGWFAPILISPKHVLITGHTKSFVSNQDILGLGTNIIEFRNYKTGTVGVTAELDVSSAAWGEVGDFAIYTLKEAVTDPNIKIYDKILYIDPPDLKFIPQNALIYTLCSNCRLAIKAIGPYSAGAPQFTNNWINSHFLEDDHYGSSIYFPGDSGTQVFVQSASLGTIYAGNIGGLPAAPGTALSLVTGAVDYMNERVAEEGYSIDWVSPSDLFTTKNLTMSTDKNYVPSTYMNGKNIWCEVTAIKGSSESKKYGDTFIAVSGDAPPSMGWTGLSEVSNTLLLNSFYNDSTLRWETIAPNSDWTDTFPPVTRFSSIKLGSTGETGGFSGGILASDSIMTTFEIPDDPGIIEGTPIYYSTWLENLFGSTGDSDSYYLVGTANGPGVGCTYTSISISPESPSAGDEVILTAHGFTAIPDRGMSQYTFVGTPAATIGAGTVTFTGPTAGFTVPAEATAGSSLGFFQVIWSNAINPLSRYEFPGEVAGITWLLIS